MKVGELIIEIHHDEYVLFGEGKEIIRTKNFRRILREARDILDKVDRDTRGMKRK